MPKTVEFLLVRVKVKVTSICKAPIHETSGIVKRYHSFTCTPYISSASGIDKPYLPLLFQPQLVLWLLVWYRFRRDGRLSRPWCQVAPAEIRTCNVPPDYNSGTQPLQRTHRESTKPDEWFFLMHYAVIRCLMTFAVTQHCIVYCRIYGTRYLL